MSANQSEKSYFQNWITVIGQILSVVFVTTFFFLLIWDLISKETNPYVEGAAFLLIPLFLVISLLLIPLGALWERSRRKKRGYVTGFPRVDFNDPVHQKRAFTTIMILTFFGLLSLFGSYRAYEFTDSNVFCGQVCHKVMEPEYTAYHNSAHARVSCVDCHIGSGAGWYVHSKLTGMYQVYSVLFGKFSRPIQTPIKDLRPAQETCEKCHWPQQFFGAIEQDHEYFLADEANTKWKTRMLMLVGGGKPPYGRGEGIHWHMNIENRIYYIASDESRQEIPWVKQIRSDGTEVLYVAEGTDYSDENRPKGELRLMDCMDCHNRPSHTFKPPFKAVNDALSFGVIDKSLPFIKRQSVEALVNDYSSVREASDGIRNHLGQFYQEKYPEIWSEERHRVRAAIDEVIKIYKTNFFPEMKVSWDVYPDDIGHFIFPGCYRCHDGEHRNDQGEAITNDCDACHHIITQGPEGDLTTSVKGLEFKHPEDIDEEWKESPCDDCHDGGNVE